MGKFEYFVYAFALMILGVVGCGNFISPDMASGTTSETTNGVCAVLTHKDGTPARDISVSLRPVSYRGTRAGGGAIKNTRTDADGRFVFDSLGPGAYKIMAYSPDSSLGVSFDSVAIPSRPPHAPDTILALDSTRLLYTGSIAGFVTSSGEGDSALVQVAGTDLSRIVAAGSLFRFDKVAAGTHTLIIGTRASDSLLSLTTDLREGESKLTGDIPLGFTGGKRVAVVTVSTGGVRRPDVTMYPMLVSLSGSNPADTAVFGNTIDPRTLHFLASDGLTWCDYEIELWDTLATPPRAVIWVTVPFVDGNRSGNHLTLLYGSNVQYVNNDPVFSLGKGYGAVWHGTAAGDSLIDAGSFSLNAYLGSNAQPASPIDHIGGTLHLYGTDPVDIGHDVNVVNGSDEITVSCWVKLSRLPFDILTIGSDSSGAHGLHSRVFVRIDSAGRLTAGGWPADSSPTNVPELKGNVVIEQNTWTYVAAVVSFRSDSISLYVNGRLDTGASGFGYDAAIVSNANSAFASIGGSLSDAAQGQIDELRIFRGPRTPEWIELDFLNQDGY